MSDRLPLYAETHIEEEQEVIDFDAPATISIVDLRNGAGRGRNRNCRGICLKELLEANVSRVAANGHLFDHGNPFIGAWACPHSEQSTHA
jgi:hypothetical protein